MNTDCWPGVKLSNLNGPVPIGFDWSKPTGTIPRLELAAKSMNALNGWLNVNRTVFASTSDIDLIRGAHWACWAAPYFGSRTSLNV